MICEYFTFLGVCYVRKSNLAEPIGVSTKLSMVKSPKWSSYLHNFKFCQISFSINLVEILTWLDSKLNNTRHNHVKVQLNISGAEGNIT